MNSIKRNKWGEQLISDGQKNQPAIQVLIIHFNSRNITGVIIFNVILNFQAIILTLACVINGIFHLLVIHKLLIRYIFRSVSR